MTILCLASYHKGHAFLEEAKRLGCRVLLVTSESLRDAEWPRDAIDETFYVPDVGKQWKMDDLILGVSHLARREVIDRIVALDDFDLEKAAALREHLRVPGMGETTTRYFRDKLAMRVKAASDGLPVPAFVHVLNEDRIRAFTARVRPPWFLKPRQQAGAIGIRRIQDEGEGFVPEEVADPLAPENILKSSGRGIFLIRNFMDETVHNKVPGGMEIRMVKKLKAGA